MTSMVSVSRFQRVLRAVVLPFFLIACGAVSEVDSHEEAVDERPWLPTNTSIVEGSPEAFALLRFVNHPTTTLVVLDVDAQLDKRAAEGIVSHRNGRDGLYGTEDDDVLESIAEVDAIKWVGPKTLYLLKFFAIDLGFLERDQDQSGEYEGVLFSFEEADAVLTFVNRVSLEELDAILDCRAASNIVDARPVLRMDALAEVKFVGAVSLRTLKDAAAIPLDAGDTSVVVIAPDIIEGQGRPELMHR